MRAPNRAWFAALLLAAAGFCADAEARTLRWARSIDATSLDPHAANTGPNLLLLHQIYEPLILRRSDGKMVPALALSWELTRDPTVWEFKLRPDAAFHDGSAFDADDVVFSLDRARSETAPTCARSCPPSSASRKWTGERSGCRTKGPDPLLPNNLTDILVMDQAWAERHGAVRPAGPVGPARGRPEPGRPQRQRHRPLRPRLPRARNPDGAAPQRGLLGPRRGAPRHRRGGVPAHPRRAGAGGGASLRRGRFRPGRARRADRPPLGDAGHPPQHEPREPLRLPGAQRRRAGAALLRRPGPQPLRRPPGAGGRKPRHRPRGAPPRGHAGPVGAGRRDRAALLPRLHGRARPRPAATIRPEPARSSPRPDTRTVSASRSTAPTTATSATPSSAGPSPRCSRTSA